VALCISLAGMKLQQSSSKPMTILRSREAARESRHNKPIILSIHHNIKNAKQYLHLLS
jgi:hypothetical protein